MSAVDYHYFPDVRLAKINFKIGEIVVEFNNIRKSFPIKEWQTESLINPRFICASEYFFIQRNQNNQLMICFLIYSLHYSTSLYNVELMLNKLHINLYNCPHRCFLNFNNNHCQLIQEHISKWNIKKQQLLAESRYLVYEQIVSLFA